MKRNETNMAEFAVKGALTRLALFFSSRRDERFSGEEIARILLETWHAYEKAKSEYRGVAVETFFDPKPPYAILSEAASAEVESVTRATDGGC